MSKSRVKLTACRWCGTLTGELDFCTDACSREFYNEPELYDTERHPMTEEEMDDQEEGDE